MVKEKYRNKIGIYFDILNCFDGQARTISHICRVSNLSHYDVLEKTKELLKLQLVEYVDRRSIEGNGSRWPDAKAWKLTEKGIDAIKTIILLEKYLGPDWRTS